MRVLMPLPNEGFDPTEAGITWRVLAEAGHEFVFATPDGAPARADERMLTGRGLGPWRPFLRARADGREAHDRMAEDPGFRGPRSFGELDADAFDALVLPGGHAPGMKPYLESEALHRVVARFFADERPVGAICHGVVVCARSEHPDTGHSVLHGRRTTALPRPMELSAWAMTALWLGSYYRTYPETVQEEVTRSLADPEDFREGPFAMLRDRPDRLDRGFTVRDGSYLSARWPGDAWRFATELRDMLGDPPA